MGVRNESSPSGQRQTDYGERLVILSCQGRGAWANQTVHLHSDGPLDYALTDQRERENPYKPTTAHIVGRSAYGESEVIAKLEAGPATCAEICSDSEWAMSTVRNSITRLRRKGLIEACGRKGRSPVYALKKCGETEVEKRET